jgi:hypothetical protein
MKSVRFIFAIIAVVATIYFGYGYIDATTEEPWTVNDLMQPKELIKLMDSKSALQPMILNIGFAGNIKNAIDIGAANDADGINKLKNCRMFQKTN